MVVNLLLEYKMTTKIELTDEEAKQFILFRQYQETFYKMVALGVFDPDIIQATLYFNKFSSLTAVDKTKRMCVNHKKDQLFALTNEKCYTLGK